MLAIGAWCTRLRNRNRKRTWFPSKQDGDEEKEVKNGDGGS